MLFCNSLRRTTLTTLNYAENLREVTAEISVSIVE